jgi:hypothetical protein
MKNLIFVFVFLVSVVSHAQFREMPQHFPVPGEDPPDHILSYPILPLPVKPVFFNSNSKQTKSSQNLLDTVYAVIHTSTYIDVLEADSAYFISGHGRHATNKILDPDNPNRLIRLKVSYSGELLWYRIDSLMRGDHFASYWKSSIIQTTDGYFIQAGSVTNDYNSWKNYPIRMAVYTKFNTDGDTLWQRLFVDTADRNTGDWPQDIIPEPDGGFTVASLTASKSKTYAPSNDFWYNDSTYVTLISYDSSGNITRRKPFFVGGEKVPVGIRFLKKQPDNGYLIGGVNRFNGPAPNLASYYLMKVDSLWDFQWLKTFGKTSNDASARLVVTDFENGQAYFAAQRRDTPITIVHGETYYTSYTHYGTFDADYNIVSDTIIHKNLTPHLADWHITAWGHVQGIASAGNGFVVCQNLGVGAYLARLDTNYQFKWHRWISHYPDFEETTFNMRQASDGGYLIVGRSNITGKGGWLVKTDTMGCALPNCADTLYHIGIETIERGRQEVFVYPNPTRDQLHISTKDNTSLPQGTLLIFNMQGALQKEVAIPAYQNQMQVNLSHLPAGIYLGRIVSTSGDGGTFRIVKR